MSSPAALFVLLAASVCAEAAEQPNPLQNVADDFLGTWVSEVIIPKDMPELGSRKGQKVQVEIQSDWAVQQSVLEWEIRIAGLGTVTKGIVGWHPAKRQITGYWFGAGTGTGQYTSSKEGDTWIEKGKSVDSDGKEHSTETRIVVKDEKTHIRQRTVDGESNPPNTWTRKQWTIT